MKFAIAEAQNQSPNKSPKNFFGESLETYDNPTGDRHNSPVVWKKYANINQIILTEAVAAPCGILLAPMDNTINPIPTSAKPIANLTGPEGFHTFSHILLKEDAKVIIKKEFRIWNQETVTSVCSRLNSLYTFQKPKIHIITKDNAVKMMVKGYLL